MPPVTPQMVRPSSLVVVDEAGLAPSAVHSSERWPAASRSAQRQPEPLGDLVAVAAHRERPSLQGGDRGEPEIGAVGEPGAEGAR